MKKICLVPEQTGKEFLTQGDISRIDRARKEGRTIFLRVKDGQYYLGYRLGENYLAVLTAKYPCTNKETSIVEL